MTEQPIRPGDRVDHIHKPYLDTRTVVSVGDGWLTLDLLGTESSHLPIKNYRVVRPATEASDAKYKAELQDAYGDRVGEEFTAASIREVRDRLERADAEAVVAQATLVATGQVEIVVRKVKP